MRKLKEWECIGIAIAPAVLGLTIGFVFPEQADAVLSKIFNVPSVIHTEQTPIVNKKAEQFRSEPAKLTK